MEDNLNRCINNLNIINWNANGLKSKRASFIIFLAQKRVDIACVTETHLIANEKFTIPGYLIYRFDRDCPKASGGVAIIIKKTISHHSLYLPYMNYLEVVGVKISFKSFQLILYSAYHAPRHKFSKTYIDNLFDGLTPTILLGDLNSKHQAWGCNKTNPNGRRLFSALEEHNLTILGPEEPTHYPTNINSTPDILDIGIFQNFNFPTYMMSLVELDSDHLPVLLNFVESALSYDTSTRLINGLVDWSVFKEKFDSLFIYPHQISDQVQVDDSIKLFTDIVSLAIAQSTVKPFKQIKYNALTTIPRRILELIKLKNVSRRLWQQNRLPYLRRRYNQLNRRVKWELDRFRFESYNKYLSNLQPHDNSLWRATKRILKEKSHIPSLVIQDKVCDSATEKANLFADYFEEAFSPNTAVQDVNFSTIVDKTLTYPVHTVEFPIKYTRPGEVSQYINTFKKNKSPGHDKIPNIVLQNLSEKGLAFLSYLFNVCLDISYFPKTWKHSEIIVIHKPGKPSSSVSSYRPISLLPTLSKLFEKILKNRLEAYLNRSSLLPPHQFGFKDHHSTCHQLLRVSEDIIKAFDMKQHTVAVFLDVTQAFDRVWHEGLRYKLQEFGIPLYLQKIISSFLDDRSFTVKIDSSLSTSRPIKAGVPQGAVLSPVLFNIFTADIPISEITSTAIFADDTLLYSSHACIDTAVTNLQHTVNDLINWFTKWKIAINPTKTEAKIFTLRNPAQPQNLNVSGHDISWNPADQAIKYLGVYLDRKLNWKFHINKKLNLAYAVLSKLYPILNRRSSLQRKNSILLYKSILRPILLYACPIWSTSSPSTMKKLQTFQNKLLRIILKCPWYVRNNQTHVELGISHVNNYIKHLTSKFFQKLHLTSGMNFFGTGQPSNLQTLRLKPRLAQDLLDINVF